MEKYIPYEKLSKKEKRKVDAMRRNTWGELNPVTRKPTNSKAYNRRRSQDWKKELPNSATFLFFLKAKTNCKFRTHTLESEIIAYYNNT